MSESFFKDDQPQPNEPSPTPEGASSGDEAGSQPRATEGSIADESRAAMIMAYLPFLCFVPLLSMKDNREVLFHARQGVMLFLIELAAALFLVDAISDIIFKGVLFSALILSVAGIYFASKGQRYRLPVVGDWAEKLRL